MTCSRRLRQCCGIKRGICLSTMCTNVPHPNAPRWGKVPSVVRRKLFNGRHRCRWGSSGVLRNHPFLPHVASSSFRLKLINILQQPLLSAFLHNYLRTLQVASFVRYDQPTLYVLLCNSVRSLIVSYNVFDNFVMPLLVYL